MTNTNVTQVPAHIAARIAARQKGAASSGIMGAVISDSASYPKISLRAGRYRLVEDGVETPVGINLDVIIVGANPKVSKIFYAKPYDGSDNVRPDCASDDGMKPNANIENPVCSNCAACPHNALGSKITPSGAKSKMCADQRHLAVVPAADPNKVYGLTIPVSGMKNLREYFKELQNYSTDPEEVVTELGFDETVSYPKITFKRKGYVPEKALDRVDALVKSDEVKVATRLLPSKGAPALAVPPTTPALPAATPAPAPAPVIDEAYEEGAEAAPKSAKPAKPKTEPVKKSSELEAKLDSLFDQ